MPGPSSATSQLGADGLLAERLWDGLHSQILRPSGSRQVTPPPSCRPGEEARSQPRGPLSSCTGRSLRTTCQQTPRPTSSHDCDGDFVQGILARDQYEIIET